MGRGFRPKELMSSVNKILNPSILENRNIPDSGVYIGVQYNNLICVCLATSEYSCNINGESGQFLKRKRKKNIIEC